MTRAATLPILALGLILVVLLGPVLDAKAIVPEQVDVQVAEVLKERAQAQRRRDRWHLIQRYRLWRQWRKNDVRRRVHRWAVHELHIGVCETGTNTVPRYGVYGYEWCAKFVAVMVRKGEPGHPLPPNPNSTASWKEAITHRRHGFRQLSLRANVKPGDIVCFRAHMGIVHRTDKHGFWSIEGNCTDRVAKRFHYWWEADVFGRVLPTRIPERFDGLR